MRWSVALPTDRADATGASIAAVARAAEDAGVDAVFGTEHPFPPAAWVASGGHHAADPLVALSFAAAATTTLRLHTNVLVAAYRNPFLTAKAVASLDALSGGRVIVGLGAGYLEPEFRALGAPFADRASRVEADVRAMRAAWTGEPVHLDGDGWRADGNAMLPRPVGRVPVWVGGNSPAAMRRAVAVGDGWMPFAARRGLASAVGTAAIPDVAELARRIDELLALVAETGRKEPFEVCATPFSAPHGAAEVDLGRLRDEAAELEAIGVTWLAVALPGDDAVAAIRAFAAAVL